MPWTQEKVLAAAPDSSSVAAGRKLATPGGDADGIGVDRASMSDADAGRRTRQSPR
ncbi:hypothetical protein [Gordonia sp. (in: high G+C Gram-positive bacteria)]|uniref:hypothetical protein n=1 Tax=Gordonia sp. (in: high G+C Gram-positive bacteria) TaxID=84139 RepID=UPI003F9DCA81